MTRLIVVVEGQSEEAFVKDVMSPHLNAHSVYASVTIVGKVAAQRRGRGGRGGGSFRRWYKDLERILRGDRSSDLRVTTLFDLYGLPADFPGLAEHGADTDTLRRCRALEAALADQFEDRRLIPYIQRHEFEALVLASLPSLRAVLDASDDLEGLEALEREIGVTPPEEINDGRTSAPSKRLLRHIPGYTKTVHGPLATSDNGLEKLRAVCPRFDSWMTQLEALAQPG